MYIFAQSARSGKIVRSHAQVVCACGKIFWRQLALGFVGFGRLGAWRAGAGEAGIRELMRDPVGMSRGV